MKKRIPVFVLAVVLFQNASLFAQYEWRHRACPIVYQGGGISFAIGGQAYVIGGDTAPPSSGNICSMVWAYDPASDSWVQKNNFPHSVNNPACFVINDTAYAGLGLDSSSVYHNDFWRYDQASDQWVPIANFPGAPRYSAMAFSLHGRGYAGCGHGNGVYDDFYAYDPAANTWAQMTNFPGGARQSGIAEAVSGKGYMGMGTGNGSYYSDIYQYNDTLDAWSSVNSFTSSGRYSLGSFAIDDTMYIIGGRDADSFYHDCWSYSASANSWTAQAGFSCLSPDSVFIQDGFAINGHGYVRLLDGLAPLHVLLEFGSHDTAFTQGIKVLGNDTLYTSTFSRVLSVPDDCAVWSDGSIGPQITISSPGIYWAHWNVACGIAADTIDITQKRTTGTASISDNDLIALYPNPTTGSFTIDNNHAKNLSVNIINLLGERLKTYTMTGSQQYFDISDLAAGIYEVQISDADQALRVMKVVKE